MLEDYLRAPIDERLRATLSFLEKLTLDPRALSAADAETARRAGVSDSQLLDAVYICVQFSVLNRLADALDFKLLAGRDLAISADMLARFGYRL